jgi:hypothetical protein
VAADRAIPPAGDLHSELCKPVLLIPLSCLRAFDTLNRGHRRLAGGALGSSEAPLAFVRASSSTLADLRLSFALECVTKPRRSLDTSPLLRTYLVDQNSASWNRIASWLRQIDGLQ